MVCEFYRLSTVFCYVTVFYICVPCGCCASYSFSIHKDCKAGQDRLFPLHSSFTKASTKAIECNKPSKSTRLKSNCFSTSFIAKTQLYSFYLEDLEFFLRELKLKDIIANFRICRALLFKF